MKTLSLLAFTALALTLLAGCSTTSSQCGSLPANCCSWDFYKQCDLIEGKTSQCIDPCGQVNCQPGVVVSRCYAVPVEKATPADMPPADLPPADVAAPASDGAPAAEVAPGAPVADFGLPPAGR